MKDATSCKQCRERKKRCMARGVGQSCCECHRRDVQCTHAPTSFPSLLLPSPRHLIPDSSGKSPQLILPQKVVEDLVEHYIYYIHDRPHSVFHLPSLRAAVRDKTLKPGLLYAIISFGCRFHPAPEIQSLAQCFLDESKRCLHLNLEDICLENIQTCILLTNLSSASSQSTLEALYNGIAIRMADIIHVPVANPSDSLIIREIKRRVWWSLFMADRWCSAGRNLPRKMNDFNRAVDLPMDDDVFYHLEPYQETLAGQRGFGIWAFSSVLANLFAPIQDLNRQIVAGDLPENDIDKAISALAGQLQSWNEGLPDDIQLNEQNIHLYKQKKLGGSFVALHLGCHHYSTLLYFQYLDVDQPSSLSQTYGERCKYHATSTSKLLNLSRNTPGCETVYAGVGHIAVISSSVLLHTLLFGPEHKLADTRESLSSNFESLIQLQQYWPSLGLTVRCCCSPLPIKTNRIQRSTVLSLFSMLSYTVLGPTSTS